MIATDALGGSRSVLLIDENDAFLSSLGLSFRQLEFEVWIENDLSIASKIAEVRHPDLIVSELGVAGKCVFDIFPQPRSLSPFSRVAIATAYPSTATAIRAIRSGFAGYFGKPVTAPLILHGIGEKVELSKWPHLDQTIWEYLNHVFMVSGSMSEAARRLGVDRRSLRRMLARSPPER